MSSSEKSYFLVIHEGESNEFYGVRETIDFLKNALHMDLDEEALKYILLHMEIGEYEKITEYRFVFCLYA